MHLDPTATPKGAKGSWWNSVNMRLGIELILLMFSTCGYERIIEYRELQEREREKRELVSGGNTTFSLTAYVNSFFFFVLVFTHLDRHRSLLFP